MIWIGCSGWQYKDWRDAFYPQGVAQRRWLGFYAQRFATVEVNNTFYMLPKPETFAKWQRETPDDFVVTVKMSRYLTHIKRLKEPEEPVKRFVSHARELGSKLGPVLLQLPPTLKRDDDALDETLGRLNRHKLRVAVEFRHESWYVAEVEELLRARGAALAMADRNSRVFSPLWATAEWGYLRFHEGAASPHPCYGKAALKSWAERIVEMFSADQDVYVYFNNDPNGCAVRDAIIFAAACRSLGRETSRVPDPDEVEVHHAQVEDWPAWFSSS